MGIKYIKQSTLNRALRLHAKWLNNEDGGRRFTINLSLPLKLEAKLKIELLDFSCADFRSADFRWANFSRADFSSANFRSADFRCADFRSANFRWANFSSANFRSADFRSADFRWADFSSANISSADFRWADFRSANFRWADFSSADFRSANFRWANFSRVNFENTHHNNKTTINMQGQRVIACQLNTSDENRYIAYYPDWGIVTAGCFQGTLEELKAKVDKVHKEQNPVIYKKYQAVFQYIETVLELDESEKQDET